MKKIAILLGLSLLISMGMQAQKNKRTSAYMYNKNGEFKKAKEVIDEAVKHEKTMHDAKTWMYRGEIYYNIAVSQDTAVKALSPDAADVAYDSFRKAIEYDTKNSYEGEIALNLINLTNLYYQISANGYNNADYDAAIHGYEKVVIISELDGRFDTTAAYYAGMSGVIANNPEVASKYLAKCVEVDYRNPDVYIYYSKSAKQLSDTARAFEILALGRERFPEEKSLQLEETQLYLETGQNDKLRESLLIATETDSTNATLFLILGQTYENDTLYDEALKYYQKSIDLGGQSAIANYNIGAIYSNEGKSFLDMANDLPLDKVKEYEELVKKANVKLEQARPYFEKVLETDPNDKDSKLALKNIYIQLKMNDKLKELNESN